MTNTYNLSVLNGESQLNDKLIQFANNGDDSIFGLNTTAVQFSSPQVDDVNLEKAISSIHNKDIQNYHRAVANWQVGMNWKSTTTIGVGDTETYGSEPALITKLTGNIPKE